MKNSANNVPMEFEKKRRISLAAGIVLNLLGGVSYAWSVFVLPLNEKFGWSLSRLAIAYTMLSLTMLVCNMTVIPFLRRRMTLRKILFLGGLLYGGGIAASGYMPDIWLFYLMYSIIGGIGNAMIYPVLIAYSQESFPEKPGFASGMMAAGLGLGSVVIAALAQWLFTLTGDVSRAMLIMGIGFMAGIIVAALFVYEVPEGFREYMAGRGKDSPDVRAAAPWLYEKPRREMLKDPLFYMLYPCVILGAVCGTMIITQGSPVMQETFGMQAGAAAAVVSVFSLANTLGRPVWGRISDMIGRLRSFILLHSVMAASMLTLFLCRIEIIFIFALMMAMLCFGGIATLVAPVTADFWGTRYITENYGITFSVFGMSSLIGAPFIAAVQEKTGSYDMAFMAGFIMAMAGLVLAVIMLRRTDVIRRGLKEERR